ncbi:nicotinamide-nucleotide adenylyltransferase [Halobacteriales archaeon QS_1_68_20]|nr:MAG: nicotinamide-nucleotide adenylyltransferase [Halobacteriales archaeon QS_1_68_20]
MRGFYPGRFQPFHGGHRRFVERIADEVDEVVVGVGSAQASHTGRNPFTAGERVTMAHRALADLETTTYVVSIEDVGQHALWPAHVRTQCPRFEVVYTNNPMVERVCEEDGLDVSGVELIDRDRYNGTDVRRRMVEGDTWRDRVPEATVDVVEEVDGVKRLRRVVEHGQHSVDGSGDDSH